MRILVVYVFIVVISEAIVVAIGLVLDRIYPALSLSGLADAFLRRPLVCMGSCSTPDRT